MADKVPIYLKAEGWNELFEAEQMEIERSRVHRGVRKDAALAGLAISGGGIRSATFALGVLQAFAKRGRLARFDYLSTVSGGGYIGSAISWLLRRAGPGDAHAGFGLGREDFPYGTEDPGDEGPGDAKPLLKFLREHGNYLTPGAGLTLLSGAAVVLRSMLLNLLVWVPLLVVLFVGLFLADGALREKLAPLLDVPLLSQFHFPERLCCGPLPCGQGELERCGGERLWSPDTWPLDLIWIAPAAIAIYLLAAFAFYSFTTGVPSTKGTKRLSRYRLSRRFEIRSGRLLAVAFLFVVLWSLPWAAEELGERMALEGGVAAVLLGIGSGLLAFFRTGTGGGKLPSGLVATLGCGLLIWGVVFLGYWMALSWVPDDRPSFAWIGLLAAVATVLAVVVNLNYTGLHRFYRDRLMETFMPPVKDVTGAEPPGSYTGPSSRADRLLLSDLKGDGHRGPYHLLNTNLVLVDSAKRRYRFRGGDSFILSPLFSGSGATGWCRTREFMGDGMTLATAMAISGAAAHPNTGVGGVGITRSKAVALLMALLNIRLGYWVHHPDPEKRRWSRTPTHFEALLYELGPWFYHETSPHLQISDGGHFENLGLYELVRRRVGVAVVLDGAADPGFDFGDLQISTRRIAEDFGARIEFDWHARLERMIPRRVAGYPQGTKLAEQGYIVGRIVYSDGNRGTLIYVKTTMIPDLGLRVKGYKGANPTFPDQSTADQFFDESQFEAYRCLGYRIGESVQGAVGEAVSAADR